MNLTRYEREAKTGSRQYMRVCANCSKPSNTRCWRCNIPAYCSGKCRLIHWRRQHKDECVPQTYSYSSSSGSSETQAESSSSGSSESQAESSSSSAEYQSCGESPTEGQFEKMLPVKTFTIPADEIAQLEVEIKGNAPLNRESEELSTEKRSVLNTSQMNLPKGHGTRDDGESCYVAIPAHTYGNGFSLYGLPNPKRGELVGLVGGRKLGKTTTLNILAGNLKPNLGDSEHPPEWEDILNRFGGSEGYLAGIKENKLTVAMKLQTLEDIKDPCTPHMRILLSNYGKENPYKVMDICQELGISLDVLSSEAKDLSDGDLQRIMVAETALKNVDSYLFDEPSNFLTQQEKRQVANVIRSLRGSNRYVCVADHDQEFMDYMSDSIFRVEGKAQVFGEVKKDAAFVPIFRRANRV